MSLLNQGRTFDFTSESVTEGHPDKLCDQIADAILDAIIREYEYSRVACEIFTTTGLVIVGGEITTQALVNIPQIIRDTIGEVGYTRGKFGFDNENCAIMQCIDAQSQNIADGVNTSLEHRVGLNFQDMLSGTGAGDQSQVFGFATVESEEFYPGCYMPLPIMVAHQITDRLTSARKSSLRYLRPDGKAQATLHYADGYPVHIQEIVVSSQHAEGVSNDQLTDDIREHVLSSLPEKLFSSTTTKLLINPAGQFITGGPKGDTGLTGRKLAVDSYGGSARHGGGAFSGKDATKVDRSAAYAARHIAKNCVAAGIADVMEVQIAYAIGVAEPRSIFVDTFGTGKISDKEIIRLIKEIFDLRPAAIIRDLDLLKPIYKKTASGGHFGRNIFSWERLNKVGQLKKAVGAIA